MNLELHKNDPRHERSQGLEEIPKIQNCDIYEICASPTHKIILATFQNMAPKKARKSMKKKKLGGNSFIKLSEMQ